MTEITINHTTITIDSIEKEKEFLEILKSEGYSIEDFIEGEELKVEVEGTLVPYRPGRMYLSNGDPGYPEEGGYCEDIGVFLETKNPEKLRVIEDLKAQKKVCTANECVYLNRKIFSLKSINIIDFITKSKIEYFNDELIEEFNCNIYEPEYEPDYD